MELLEADRVYVRNKSVVETSIFTNISAMSWQQDYLQRFYSRDDGWVDGTTEFHQLCADNIKLSSRVLEIGAGPPNETSRYLAGLGSLVGLDIDPDVRVNDALVEAHVFDGGEFPFKAGTFDACVSNYVLEHLRDPAQHLREVRRVLRVGGTYVFRTPNRWHYVPLVSSLTPHAFHRLVANRLRSLPLDAHDPYPTFYAMNTRGAVRRHAERSDLNVLSMRLIEKEPMYGLVARPLFLTFMIYERLVNSNDGIAFLRSTILGVLNRRVESSVGAVVPGRAVSHQAPPRVARKAIGELDDSRCGSLGRHGAFGVLKSL